MSGESAMRGTNWEITEHNWHGVATLDHQTLQWHAYVEPVDAPNFRTWAGQAFDNLAAAQTWCREEIARQGNQPVPRPIPPATPPPEAWAWLWGRLQGELGPDRVTALRAELEQWMQQRSKTL